MKFAINYSPQAAELLNQGRIQVDVYKVTDWPDMIAEAQQQRPVYVHFPLFAGRGKLDTPMLDHVERLLDETGTPYVNAHLAPNAGELGQPVDSRDPAHRSLLRDAMLRDINSLTERFGAERVILENAIWDDSPAYMIPRHVLEPDLISEVVHRTGCGFLLDVAHAAASARYLGISDHGYLAQLPVDRIRELHITGLSLAADGTWKDHAEMSSADWLLTEWVIERVRSGMWGNPWVAALEYGGVGPGFLERSKAEVITVDAPRLYDLAQMVPMWA